MRLDKGFLSKKYPKLHESKEVRKATGETKNSPDYKIDSYLERLEDLVFDPRKKQETISLGDKENTERPRALSLLRQMVISKYITPNKEKMAQGASRLEERVARQMGINAQYNEEMLGQRGEIAVGDVVSSLDQWIKYLSNPDEQYPVWFRYYAFRNILGLGEYDKDKKEFPKRSKGTTKLFPDVDRGALAYIQERIDASQDDEKLKSIVEGQKWQGIPEKHQLTSKKAKEFAELPFAKQYAEGIRENGEISPELKKITEGKWVHYKQGDGPRKLWLSLQNKGAAWCTKGYSTAEKQIENGDFYVYYTLDSQGNPTIPRIAIRMNGNEEIAENPRGVFDSQQNLEPNMIGIMEDKIKEFGPEAEKFKKKSADMKYLTEIEEKIKNNKELTKKDLIFLYEMESKIKGFGYRKDPRIEEIRNQRDIKKDLSLITGLKEEEISITKDEVLKDKEGKIKFHYGHLNFSTLTSVEGLNLPKKVKGDLNLNSLTSIEGLKLPEEVRGNLGLNSLTSAEGLDLPKRVTGFLDLGNLISSKGLILPEIIDGALFLGKLVLAEGLELPKIIKDTLDLSSLTSAKGLKLPEEVWGNLALDSLTSSEGLILPEKVKSNLNLKNLTSAKGLILPEVIDGILLLGKLASAEGLKLPEVINEDLVLSNLTSAEGLNFPKIIGGALLLNKITSAEGLKLPEEVGGNLNLKSLTSAKGLKFPKEIGGNLDLENLISIEGSDLPKRVGGHLDLGSLVSAKGLKLPKEVKGGLNLRGLTSYEGLNLPEKVEGDIFLKELDSDQMKELKSRYSHLKIYFV